MEKRLIILVHTELKSLGKSATKRFKFGRINSFNNIFIYIHVMVFVRGSARIRHTRSGEVYTVFAEQIEFDELDAEERGMSAEVTYQAVVDHPDLGELAWTLSEYPVGAENYRETDVGEHEVLQNIEFGLGAPSLAAQRDQTIQSLVDWFFERYEDPVHAMPYNGKEGGYLYVGGGPFDANEQLFDAFPEMPKGIIEAAVNEIEAEGTLEWAARRDRQDFDDEETLFENRPDTDGDDHVGHAHDENEASQLNDLIQALPDQVDPGYNVSNRGKASVAAPTDLGDSPVDDPLFVDLKSTAEEFLSNLQGSNGHVDLFDEVVAYVESLRGDTYSVQRHYARGVRFSNIVAETQALIKGDALPPLRAGQAAKMRSILDLHAAYIMSSPEGRKLSEGASAYQQTPQALATTKVAAQKISQAVEQAPDIFDEEVRATVSQTAEQIGAGPQPARSTQVAVTSIGALGLRLLKWTALIGATSLLTSAVGGSSLGVAVSSAGAAAVDGIVAFLISQAHSFHVIAGALSSDLGWARPLAHIFQRLASLRLPGTEDNAVS